MTTQQLYVVARRAEFLGADGHDRAVGGAGPIDRAACRAFVDQEPGAAALLHGAETEFFGDQGYQGHAAAIRQRAPKAADRTNRRWRTKLHVYSEVREQNRIKSKPAPAWSTCSR